MTADESRLGFLAHKVRELDPGSRALLDLSVRRGLPDVEIAGVLGTDPAYVTAQRNDVMETIAADLSLEPSELDALRQALLNLPPEAWLPKVEPAPTGATNGHATSIESGAPSSAVSPEESEVLAPGDEGERPAEAPDAAVAEPADEGERRDTAVAEPADEDVVADIAPAEEARAEQAPAEQAPAEEGAAGEAGAVEAAATGEAAAGAAPAEEAPAEEAPAEEAPTDEAPTDEAPLEEAAAPERVGDEDVVADTQAAAEDESARDGERPAPSAVTRPRRPRRIGPLIATLAIVLVGAALVVALALGGGDDDDEPAQQQAEPGGRGGGEPGGAGGQSLEALPGVEGVSGTADVRRGRLRISIAGLERTSGRYEVWLYDSVIDAESLGTLRRRGDMHVGRFPARNLGDYRYVDISLERRGGTANHSGRSVARIRTDELR